MHGERSRARGGGGRARTDDRNGAPPRGEIGWLSIGRGNRGRVRSSVRRGEARGNVRSRRMRRLERGWGGGEPAQKLGPPKRRSLCDRLPPVMSGAFSRDCGRSVYFGGGRCSGSRGRDSIGAGVSFFNAEVDGPFRAGRNGTRTSVKMMPRRNREEDAHGSARKGGEGCLLRGCMEAALPSCGGGGNAARKRLRSRHPFPGFMHIAHAMCAVKVICGWRTDGLLETSSGADTALPYANH